MALLTVTWLSHGELLAILEGDSLTHPMLITARPEGHRESRNEVGSLNPAVLPILTATP